MGFLNRLFHPKEAPAVVVECPHTALTARWDQAADIGKQELATSFHCESCGVDLAGDEGRELQGQRGH